MGSSGETSAQRVNPELVVAFLDPLSGLADDDEAATAYLGFDANDETAVRALIRDLLLPAYRRWSPATRQMAKRSLAYALTFQRDRLERWFNAVLPPISPPDDPPRFFEWLWEELFGDEPWQLEHPGAFTVEPNPWS